MAIYCWIYDFEKTNDRIKIDHLFCSYSAFKIVISYVIFCYLHLSLDGTEWLVSYCIDLNSWIDLGFSPRMFPLERPPCCKDVNSMSIEHEWETTDYFKAFSSSMFPLVERPSPHIGCNWLSRSRHSSQWYWILSTGTYVMHEKNKDTKALIYEKNKDKNATEK